MVKMVTAHDLTTEATHARTHTYAWVLPCPTYSLAEITLHVMVRSIKDVCQHMVANNVVIIVMYNDKLHVYTIGTSLVYAYELAFSLPHVSFGMCLRGDCTWAGLKDLVPLIHVQGKMHDSTTSIPYQNHYNKSCSISLHWNSCRNFGYGWLKTQTCNLHFALHSGENASRVWGKNHLTQSEIVTTSGSLYKKIR